MHPLISCFIKCGGHFVYFPLVHLTSGIVEMPEIILYCDQLLAHQFIFKLFVEDLVGGFANILVDPFQCTASCSPGGTLHIPYGFLIFFLEVRYSLLDLDGRMDQSLGVQQSMYRDRSG